MKRVNEYGTYGEAPAEDDAIEGTNTTSDDQVIKDNINDIHPKSE